MRTHTVPVLALIVALGSIPLVTNVSAQQAPKKKGPARRALKVGVVDIGRLFQEYKRKDDFEAAINEQRKRLKTEIDKEYDNLLKQRRELEKSPYRRGSEPWLREQEKLQLATYRHKLKKERMQTALKNEVEHNTLQILKEIKGSLRQWGTRLGYDLILKTDSGDRSGEGSELVVHFQEEIFRAQISDVAYYDKAHMDITESVLKYINRPANLDYWKKQAAKQGKRKSSKKKTPPKKAPK